MSNVPANLKYSDSHEWVLDNGDGTVTIGITDHAQELLGDLVHLELPEEGQELEIGADCGVIESVKAASDLVAPLAGEVTEVNEDLLDSPELANTSPYDEAWMFKVKVADASEVEALMDAAAYEELLENE